MAWCGTTNANGMRFEDPSIFIPLLGAMIISISLAPVQVITRVIKRALICCHGRGQKKPTFAELQSLRRCNLLEEQQRLLDFGRLLATGSHVYQTVPPENSTQDQHHVNHDKMNKF